MTNVRIRGESTPLGWIGITLFFLFVAAFYNWSRSGLSYEEADRLSASSLDNLTAAALGFLDYREIDPRLRAFFLIETGGSVMAITKGLVGAIRMPAIAWSFSNANAQCWVTVKPL